MSSISGNENVLSDFNKDYKYGILSNPFWGPTSVLRGQMQTKQGYYSRFEYALRTHLQIA